MTFLNQRMTRAQALKAGAAGTIGVYLAACGSEESGGSDAVTINWLTWADHYSSEQLKQLRSKTGIRARPTLITDNAETLLKLKQGGGVDFVSADALWVPKFLEDGLTDSFDLGEIKTSSQLYSVAREFPFWQDGANYMAYPFGWGPQQLYYNPANIPTRPDSWQVLADPKLRKRVVLLNAPTDMMAVAGLATGAKDPYGMTPDEIASAKGFLAAVKPNVLKLAAQATDINAALVDGSAWIAFNSVGTDVLVKEAGGPEIEAAFPTEGTIGFIDGQLIVSASPNKDRFVEFLENTQDARWIAQNFLKHGRPLFNEKAYKLLVDQGHKERADRFNYNKPELALEMRLKGPTGNEQGYIDAFNEVFGA